MEIEIVTIVALWLIAMGMGRIFFRWLSGGRRRKPVENTMAFGVILDPRFREIWAKQIGRFPEKKKESDLANPPTEDDPGDTKNPSK